MNQHNNLIMRSARKKQKVHLCGNGGSAEVAVATSEQQETSNKERFMKRWIEEDRAAMLRLINHSHNKKGNVDIASYSWAVRDMQLSLPPADPVDLIGAYDIVFVLGQPTCTDQNYEGGRISRTSGGTLSIFQRHVPPGNFFYDEGTQIVHGTIKVDQTTAVLVTDTASSDGTWEPTLQMTGVEFQEHPNDHFENDEGPTFGITKNWEMCAGDGNEALIRVLTNAGTLSWTPREEQDPQSSNTHDNVYIQFIQEQVAQRYVDDCHRWQEESSWLCNHFGLPCVVARIIRSFNRHPLPAPQWSWQEGDLLLELRMTDYETSWTTFYVARPGQSDLKRNLLMLKARRGMQRD